MIMGPLGLLQIHSGATGPLLTLCGPCADFAPLEGKIQDVFSGEQKPQPHHPTSEAIITEAILLLDKAIVFVLKHDFREIV